MSTIKFLGSTFLFGTLLLVALYAVAYLVLDGPAIPAWVMIIPGLMFGLTITAMLDKPLDRAIDLP